MPEQGIAFYLEKVCKVEQRIKIAKQEIDVFLTDYNIGIEYDGKYFHPVAQQNKEFEKEQQLKNNGIKLIRIKESDINNVDGNGERLLKSVDGATRPDLLRNLGSTCEAVEVKYYDLEHNLSGLCTELKRQVGERVINLPQGYTQRVVLDVTGRGYSRDIIENAITNVGESLYDIYPNIPINVIGA